jgi:hypothetical protein
MHLVNWKNDLQILEDRTWIDSNVAEVIREICNPSEESYRSYCEAANELIDKSLEEVVERHPDRPLLANQLAFAGILNQMGFKKEANLVKDRFENEVLWIKEAYGDEENPFPFSAVGEIQKKHKETVESIKVLDRFLKTIK